MAVAMAVAMVMMVMHPDLGALGTTGVMAIMMMVVMRVMMVMMMAMHVLLTPVRMLWSRPPRGTRRLATVSQGRCTRPSHGHPWAHHLNPGASHEALLSMDEVTPGALVMIVVLVVTTVIISPSVPISFVSMVVVCDELGAGAGVSGIDSPGAAKAAAPGVDPPRAAEATAPGVAGLQRRCPGT